MEYARAVVTSGRAGINQICSLLGISKKTYYYSRDPNQTLDYRYKRLKKIIGKIIQKNPSYGYRRIKKALLEEYDETINHKVLLKILRIWGLQLKRRIRPHKKSWMTKILDFLELRANLLWRIVKDNLLNSCFQVIVSDVTELFFKGGKAYLCVHLDIFGKMIYGWQLSTNPDSRIVLQSFRKAVKIIKRLLGVFPSGLIIHQDRGSIYTGSEYISSVLKEKCLLSYSRRGEPGDNAVNESFFSRLKEEWRDVFYEAQNFEELKKMVRKAIDYYNYERYHSSIGLMSPFKFTEEQAGYLTIKQLKVVS